MERIKVCTNKDQSKCLIELGLNPNSADMSLYEGTDGNWYPEVPFSREDIDLPAWTYSALMKVMPKLTK